MAIINPTSPSTWLKKKIAVLAGATTVVHSLPETSMRSIDYLFTFYNIAQDKTKHLQFCVTREGATIQSTVFNRIGSALAVQLSASLSSGFLEVTVINGEAFDVEVEYAYLILGRG